MNLFKFVYVLECEADKKGPLYYVGITTDMNLRWQQHLTQTGSNFTALHTPLRIIKLYVDGTEEMETAVAKEWAERHGTDRVSGGNVNVIRDPSIMGYKRYREREPDAHVLQPMTIYPFIFVLSYIDSKDTDDSFKFSELTRTYYIGYTQRLNQRLACLFEELTGKDPRIEELEVDGRWGKLEGLRHKYTHKGHLEIPSDNHREPLKRKPLRQITPEWRAQMKAQFNLEATTKQ